MSGYATEIIVNTKINTKQATSQLLSLENRMLKAADKAEHLNKKMREMESIKTPREEYTHLEKELETANKELQQLINKQNNLEDIGFKTGAAWNSINEEVAAAAIRVDEINEKMYQLEKAGKAFTLGSDTQEYSNLSQQYQYAQNEYEALQQKHKEIIKKMESAEKSYGKESASTFGKAANAAKTAFKGIASTIKSISGKVSGFFKKMGDTAKKVFHRMHDDTKKQNSLFSTMKTRLKGITLSLVFFNWITKAFNAMISSVKEGVRNLSLYSQEYNHVVSDMVSALATLKNAFATAFAPIITVAIPYLTKFINVLTLAVNKVAQFIAALTGKTTWTKAKQQVIDYADGLGEVAGQAKKAYTVINH